MYDCVKTPDERYVMYLIAFILTCYTLRGIKLPSESTVFYTRSPRQNARWRDGDGVWL